MITLKEFVSWFDTKAEAARTLGWTPQHLQDRMKAKKPIWICERTKKWFIEGGKYE